MALTSIAAAQTQLNANLDWDSRSAAAPLALEAVRFLLFNRPTSSSLGATKIDYEALTAMEKRLSDFCRNSTTTGAASRASFTRGRGRCS